MSCLICQTLEWSKYIIHNVACLETIGYYRGTCTHVNAQFQVISINISKDNCAFSTSPYVAYWLVIIYISNKPHLHIKQTSFTYQTSIIYISNKHHLHIKQTSFTYQTNIIYISNKHHLHVKQTSISQERSEILRWYWGDIDIKVISNDWRLQNLQTPIFNISKSLWKWEGFCWTEFFAA